ncbi:MAG: LL-diaminopimelate aminotransferase [Proteobacteria bacterium]|nr:LL-diaminopimelate aminotransferase [Alphaproteobacteria bacterium]NCC02852.1 LL-diaminopimelate aminotransferase [Pseudomonadota bacterium]
MTFERATRLTQLPPYLFKEIDRMKAEVAAKGVDVINLGVGDPDQPTPDFVIKALQKTAEDPANHQYPSYSGMGKFRVSAAAWVKKRFGLDFDPNKEIVTLIGSKEGIAHFPLAYLNPGDIALVPTPAYPVYHSGTLFAGGVSHFMPLTAENNFLPDLNAIPADVAKKAKIMFINYPNNPTGATCDLAFFEKVVAFAKANSIIVAHDAAYSEMNYEGYQAPSFMQVDGARDVGIEFHSLSKSFNMTGWRIGFAIGNADIVDALGQIKSNIDSGAFNAIQEAGIAALDSDQSFIGHMRKIYTERRDVLVPGLREAGLEVELPKATFFVWCRTPKGVKSADFTALLLEKAGIVTTPGNGFGEPGEGYVRFALTVSKERLAEAVDRIKKLAF